MAGVALSIHIDGAARGNPGPAACAYVIERDGTLVEEAAESLGTTTNNVAEYTALLRALERAAELGADRVHIRSDSELLVKQMNGVYRVKDSRLRELHRMAKQLASAFGSVKLEHIPRAANSHADRLCNEALDGDRALSAAGRERAATALTLFAPDDGKGETARAHALDCLREAAAAWARGNGPAPEEVWEKLWSILQKSGLV